MKKSFLKYYDDEYQYLVEAGREFAENQPDRAKYLKIRDDARDPYVERLFEGFAFLTARIRQRLDSELPEFTENLLELMWPHYLRPIPSMAILQFYPKEGILRKPQVVLQGTEVLSNAIGKKSIVCKFRTCWDVTLLPIALKNVKMSTTDRGYSAITFQFRLLKGVEYESVFSSEELIEHNGVSKLNRIRLFVRSDPPITASLLYLHLTYYLERAIIRTSGANTHHETELQILPAGFKKDEGLFPYSTQTLSGHRLLQEYFAFPQKFRFLDIVGLDQFVLEKDNNEFEIKAFLNKKFPEELRVGTSNFDLHCTPIINLFDGDIRPTVLNHLKTEYPVIPDSHDPDSINIYSINKVTGVEINTRKQHEYVAFNSFKHTISSDEQKELRRFYKASSRFDPKGKWETALSFGISHNLEPETISIAATCTNGYLAGTELRENTILNPTEDYQHHATFKNLSQPTLPIFPPKEEGFQWRILSHMALNFLTLSDSHAVKELLELYNWSRTDANIRRIDGITNVKSESANIMLAGSLIRGTKLIIDVEEDHYSDSGDIYLFGTVLKEVFSHFVSINSFIELELNIKPAGGSFIWPPSIEMGIPTI